MTTRQIAFATVVLALLACAVPALATVGGPLLLDVLGWDPSTKRVYVHFIPTDGGALFGDVISYGLESASGPEREAWVRDGENMADDRVMTRRLDDLRRRLRPLTLQPAAVLPWESNVVARDSLDDGFPGQPVRYRVRARWERDPQFEFVGWGSPVVLLRAIYGIPGRSERLFVFAFVGDREEGGYEMQLPMIVRSGETGLRQVGPAGGR
jgi:hypothetical protein